MKKIIVTTVIASSLVFNCHANDVYFILPFTVNGVRYELAGVQHPDGSGYGTIAGADGVMRNVSLGPDGVMIPQNQQATMFLQLNPSVQGQFHSYWLTML